MARQRFSRKIIASSRGAFVYHSHNLYIQKCHEENSATIKELSANIKVKSKYFVKCFGTLIQITEEEAIRLTSELVIVI